MHGPQRRVRVLPAVFTDAGHVALDVAGAGRHAIERGRRGAARCRRRGGRAVRPPPPWPGARARDRRRPKSPPTTARSRRSGTRRSPSSRAASRRRSTRGGTSRRPSALRSPRVDLRGVPPIVGRARRHRRAARTTSANGRRIETRNQPSQTLSPLPPAPTRFMPSFQSPVPMSGRPWAPVRQADRDRAEAVLVQRACLGRDRRLLVGFVLVRVQQAGGQERRLLVEHAVVARRGDVLQRRIHQPQPVVGESRANALAARLVPPVLDVSFDELTRGGAQQVRAHERRRATSAAPACPAADRGIRRRRWTDRTPIAPRRGTPASDRAASG